MEYLAELIAGTDPKTVLLVATGVAAVIGLMVVRAVLRMLSRSVKLGVLLVGSGAFATLPGAQFARDLFSGWFPG